jgi:hypothetical protein
MDSRVLDIVMLIPLVQAHADQFSSEDPQHAENVSTFLQELRRITSELQSGVYARQKSERGW